MVLVTDGNSGTGTDFSDAKGAVLSAGTTVDSFGVQSGKLGGEAHAARRCDRRRVPGDDQGDRSHRHHDVGGPAAVRAVPLHLPVHVEGRRQRPHADGRRRDDHGFLRRRVRREGRRLRSPTRHRRTRSGFIASFQNDFGKYLAVILGLLGAALGAYAIIHIVGQGQHRPRRHAPAVLRRVRGAAPAKRTKRRATRAWPQTAVMQRAVELTGQFAERRGFLTRVEAALERANLPLRAAEAMLLLRGRSGRRLAALVARHPQPVRVPRRARDRCAASAGGAELPVEPPAPPVRGPCCPTRCSCCPARCAPATR